MKEAHTDQSGVHRFQWYTIMQVSLHVIYYMHSPVVGLSTPNVLARSQSKIQECFPIFSWWSEDSYRIDCGEPVFVEYIVPGTVLLVPPPWRKDLEIGTPDTSSSSILGSDYLTS
jgi:hypothetical protein